MNTVKHTPGIAGNDRVGWYVQWQNGQGFRSAMPDRETAIMCAGASVLAEALRAAMAVIETLSPGPAQYSGYCKARSALALVDGEAPPIPERAWPRLRRAVDKLRQEGGEK